MLGKLTLERDPVGPADPAGRRRFVAIAVVGGDRRLGRARRASALSLARVDHQRRPQADRRHVRRCSAS